MPEREIIKLDLNRCERVRYPGRVLEQDRDHILLEAYFSREDTPVEDMLLQKGDRFIETFFQQRWYNIFEIHARQDDHLKGWYCNIGYPAEINNDSVSYVDLALDLLVYPDGRQIVLDQDEFNQLPLTPQDRQFALNALDELKHLFVDHGVGVTPTP